MASPLVTETLKHVAVCICTYKRPDLLKRLLDGLRTLETGGLFTYSIVVADNDALRSAETIVKQFGANSTITIKYCVEPRQNIALARNIAVSNASGDFLAFIDDDEIPTRCWLLTLFNVCSKYQVDGVLGPVKRHFDEAPPKWIQKSRLYDRHVNSTGDLVIWEEARTGNVLLRREIIGPLEQPFQPQFRAGEDQDFFRRKIEAGRRFIWSADAVVYEVVPPARWSVRYMLRKALLRGATASLQPSCGVISVAKSIVAVPVYTLALPFALIAGHHRFVELLVKLCDHVGKLLALIGLNPVQDQYVTE